VNHEFLRILAGFALAVMLVFVPMIVYSATDRFRRSLDAGQYALVFALIAFVGAFLFVPALSIVFGTALVALIGAMLSARSSLTGLTYERTFTPSRLFPGDQADMTLRITNRKLLPLAWLHIVDPLAYTVVRSSSSLDDLLHFSGGMQAQETQGYALVNRTAIGPYSVVERRYTVEARARGVYLMGPARVQSGDPFGLDMRQAVMGGTSTVIVYPRLIRGEDADVPFRQAMGELIARRALLDDPTLIAGSRDYQVGDPLHHVHWKATARTASLQVRLSDPSTTAQLMIVLNTQTFQQMWQGIDPDRMEAAIEVAASLALWAVERAFPVGLRSNGVVAGADRSPRIAPSAAPQHLTSILDMLARLAFSGQQSAESMLMDEATKIPPGGSILFVTPLVTAGIAEVLTSRRLRGRVAVLYCGRHAAPVIRGVPTTVVAPTGAQLHAVS
jgi:uncharacterized protein (DUF58 family)